ncbi:hypothetical protein [Psychroserpens sp.]|uniref:hypothetical protein n=1 Tax=Psychroserpens sp. TaxID=2020870 RepID=UPI003C770465
MKKFMLSMVAIAALSFSVSSCSSDDDGGGSDSDCETCSFDLLGTLVESEYCDNGDGTITVTTEGQSQTEDLPTGTSFDEFIAQLETLGFDCD